jgi:hypothetical protein
MILLLLFLPRAKQASMPKQAQYPSENCRLQVEVRLGNKLLLFR